MRGGAVKSYVCEDCAGAGVATDEGGDPCECERCDGEGWVFIDWSEIMQDERDAEFKDTHGRYF